MATVELTAENFEEVVSGDATVLIDFWASWCGPCRQFAPIYDAASQRHDDVVFAKVDTDAQQELAGMFGVRSIPTVVAIRERAQVFNQPGVLPAAALDDLIGQVKALDMDSVRSQVAEAEAAAKAAE